MSPNLDAAKIIWPSVAAIFPRNPIILLIDVYSLLRRDAVDEMVDVAVAAAAADDNADDDNEDGGGGGVGYCCTFVLYFTGSGWFEIHTDTQLDMVVEDVSL